MSGNSGALCWAASSGRPAEIHGVHVGSRPSRSAAGPGGRRARTRMRSRTGAGSAYRSAGGERGRRQRQVARREHLAGQRRGREQHDGQHEQHDCPTQHRAGGYSWKAARRSASSSSFSPRRAVEATTGRASRGRPRSATCRRPRRRPGTSAPSAALRVEDPRRGAPRAGCRCGARGRAASRPRSGGSAPAPACRGPAAGRAGGRAARRRPRRGSAAARAAAPAQRPGRRPAKLATSGAVAGPKPRR